MSVETICSQCDTPKLWHTVWGHGDCTAPYGWSSPVVVAELSATESNSKSATKLGDTKA